MSDTVLIYITIFVWGLIVGHTWGVWAERRAERKHLDEIAKEVYNWTNTNG